MYAIYGNKNSSQTIIAVPALGERKEMFQPLAQQLNDYKWLVFDLPGSHKQQLVDYSIPTFCEYILQTMASLQIHCAHFIGSSLGAWVIQAITARNHDVVCSLTLLDGGHYFLGERNTIHVDEQLPTGIESFEDIRQAVHEFTYSMPNLDPQGYKAFEQYFLHNYLKQGDYYAHHFNELAYNALSSELTTVDYCLQSSSLPMLLLIAQATADELSIEKSEVFGQQYENATVTMISHGQHYLPLTNTGEVANAIAAFYATIRLNFHS